MKTVEKIAEFLKVNTEPDLAARYHGGMEVQVDVSPDGGEKQDGGELYKNAVGEAWWQFRFPRKNEKPNEYTNLYDLEKHVERIALSGWDYEKQQSFFVAFDFDDITGHADGVGISQTELDKVREAACAIPWVEVRKSKSGNGLHLYVTFADPPTIKTRSEHAALARAVLAEMSTLVNFDFNAGVDACGSIMWIMSRSVNKHNGGLTLVKAADEPLSKTPENWRDHLDVVMRKRSKVRVPGIADEQAFDNLADSQMSAPLDADHRKFLKAITNSDCYSNWQQDHHLLATHTKAVEQVCDELQLDGVFKTISPGTDLRTPNCFMFPLPNGKWQVYRYSMGVNEAPTWTQSPSGWTTCTINEPLSLETAAKLYHGIRDRKEDSLFRQTMLFPRSKPWGHHWTCRSGAPVARWL